MPTIVPCDRQNDPVVRRRPVQLLHQACLVTSRNAPRALLGCSAT
jgi:hypothetical protein